MNLKNYYYDTFGQSFSNFESFIEHFGNWEDFDSILHYSQTDIPFNDKIFPLYDYFFNAFSYHIHDNIVGKFKFDLIVPILGKSYIEFMLSSDGLNFTQNENLSNPKGFYVSVYNDAIASLEHYEDFSYRSNVIYLDNYYFLEQYSNIENFEYIKKSKILSLMRKFIQYGGVAGDFNNTPDEYIFDLWNIMQEGIIMLSDTILCLSSVSQISDLIEIQYG